MSTDAPVTDYALELSKHEGTDYFMVVNMDVLMEYYTLFIKSNKGVQQARKLPCSRGMGNKKDDTL